jgi:Uma2 family endonuclease
VWEENGKYPNFIIEILSPTTAKTDRGTKKELYQDIFRTPEYFLFDSYTLEFAGFYLIHGKYQPVEPNEKGHFWSEELGLYLGIFQGLLRYFTPVGTLVPTPEESAEMEAKKSQRLAAKLRELNIDPDTI